MKTPIKTAKGTPKEIQSLMAQFWKMKKDNLCAAVDQDAYTGELYLYRLTKLGEPNKAVQGHHVRLMSCEKGQVSPGDSLL